MTVVPAAFQLVSWIPAWWRAAVGGDDLVGLLGREALPEVARLRSGTVAVTAYCPELGVGTLPGPKPATEAAVAAGQAVILHGPPGLPASLLVPAGGGWSLLAGGPSRPVDLDLRRADAELAEAVVTAEHELRAVGTTFGLPPRTAAVLPLPPDASSQRRGLLVRAVRLWTAAAAVPADQRPEPLRRVLHAAAGAALAAYFDPAVVPVRHPQRADRRFA